MVIAKKQSRISSRILTNKSMIKIEEQEMIFIIEPKKRLIPILMRCVIFAELEQN